ncbi:MAG TPA: hypothetical protein VHO68_03650, partial [Bacteroidales bacterium]|nr:hypothetical protein [Bacteroidales bacterium]
NYGARPLKRAIQKYLEDPMAELLIRSDLHEGDVIFVGFSSTKDEIKIKVHKKKAEIPESFDEDVEDSIEG